ncbi:8-oxo-dGTP diphosphatase [bacterium]|nr:8-oxo-dGTP diphosphatase [bacterium]
MKTINATLCYIQHNNHTLMLHRIKKENDLHQDKWNGLGGKFESGESPEDCLLREIKEESGLTLLEYSLVGLLTFPKFDGNNDWQVFLYQATKFEGEIIESQEGKLEWIPNSQLLDLNLWEGDKYFIKWMLENRFFSAKFNYLDKQLIDYSVNFY